MASDGTSTPATSSRPQTITIRWRPCADAKRPNSAASPPSAENPTRCGQGDKCALTSATKIASPACRPATSATRTEAGWAISRLCRSWLPASRWRTDWPREALRPPCGGLGVNCQ
ncbi:Uncharacterised protein [Bordetella pertussis]|nr:Uncharacterised protein [Bordetella pertussis]CFW51068.1 Uncharacterised protein [Bordetella pertussis]